MKATAAMLVAASLMAASGITGTAQAADQSLANPQAQNKSSQAMVLGDRQLDDVYAGHVYLINAYTYPPSIQVISAGTSYLPPHLGAVCINGHCFVIH